MAFASISSLMYAQTEVVQGVMRGKDYGVTYALPKSMIEVEAKVNKVKYYPGELAKYANRYLRLNDVSTEAAEYYELISLGVRSVGVADKDNIYFIKMKDKTVAPLVELTDDGVIKSINVPIRKETANETNAPVSKERKALNPHDFLTEDILMANSSAKVAELVAKEIYNIRDSKNALVRGQADFMPNDGEQMRIMLETLEDQEKALTELFTGKYNKEEKTYTTHISPENSIDNEVVMRFSNKLGIVNNNDLAGEPIYLSLKNVTEIDNTIDDGKKKMEGIAYNVPGKGIVSLKKDGKVIIEKEIPITQFGLTEYLAPALFNKNSTIKIIFNPTTGGLTKVDREEDK